MSFHSSSEAGRSHCDSLCSFGVLTFSHPLLFTRSFLITHQLSTRGVWVGFESHISSIFASFLAIYDIRNTIYDLWRARSQPIRTFGEITAHIKILPVHQPYLYQKLSQKATQLRLLGMSYQQIAKSLNITKKTAIRACQYGGR